MLWPTPPLSLGTRSPLVTLISYAPGLISKMATPFASVCLDSMESLWSGRLKVTVAPARGWSSPSTIWPTLTPRATNWPRVRERSLAKSAPRAKGLREAPVEAMAVPTMMLETSRRPAAKVNALVLEVRAMGYSVEPRLSWSDIRGLNESSTPPLYTTRGGRARRGRLDDPGPHRGRTRCCPPRGGHSAQGPSLLPPRRGPQP